MKVDCRTQLSPGCREVSYFYQLTLDILSVGPVHVERWVWSRPLLWWDYKPTLLAKFIKRGKKGSLHTAWYHWKSAGFQSSFCYNGCLTSVSSVQLLSHVRLFATPWLKHARPPCPSPSPGVHSNSRPSSRWCHPAISSSVIPFFSCPRSLPASESFPMSQLFTWGGQSIGVWASASVLPMNTQGWSPLEWTDWISLQSKGLSRVFSNTTVQKHQFFSTQLCSQSNSHIHTWPLEKPKPWLDGPLLAK